MNIVGLNTRIMIQKNETVTDRYGNHRSVWIDYFSCWATASESATAAKRLLSQRRDTAFFSVTGSTTLPMWMIWAFGRIVGSS